MNKIKYLIFTFVLFFALSFNVKANSISSINLNVHLNKDGSALVKETWNANLDFMKSQIKKFGILMIVLKLKLIILVNIEMVMN